MGCLGLGPIGVSFVVLGISGMSSFIQMANTSYQVDRTALSVVSLDEQEEDVRRYWREKTPHERLVAVEMTRQLLYGYDPATARLQRVFEIAQRA